MIWYLMCWKAPKNTTHSWPIKICATTFRKSPCWHNRPGGVHEIYGGCMNAQFRSKTRIFDLAVLHNAFEMYIQTREIKSELWVQKVLVKNHAKFPWCPMHASQVSSIVWMLQRQTKRNAPSRPRFCEPCLQLNTFPRIVGTYKLLQPTLRRLPRTLQHNNTYEQNHVDKGFGRLLRHQEEHVHVSRMWTPFNN